MINSVGEINKAVKNPMEIIIEAEANYRAEIYTAADVFFNPTYEDNYPTVNLEAEACGTKVVTYATGGSPETLRRSDSVVIPVGDYAGFAKMLME